MSAASDRGREVRQRLLAAAAALIAERGWNAVSTRTLAERAGVAAGVVHYHFASLPALLNEAALGAVRELVTELGPFLAQPMAPRELVDGLLAALEPYSGSDATSTLLVEAYLAATRDPALRAGLAEAIAEVRDSLAEALRSHGIAAPAATAAVLVSAVDGIMLHRALDPTTPAAAIAPVLHRLVERPT